MLHATCKYLKSERLGEDDVGRAELAVAVGLDGKHDVLRQPHTRGRHVELAVAEARPLASPILSQKASNSRDGSSGSLKMRM